MDGTGSDRAVRRPPGLPAGLVPALLLALPAAVPALSPAVARLLEYDRARLAAGEAWRAVGCHWTHWTLDHLFWDVGVLALLAALSWRLGRGRTAATLIAAALAIPLALWLLMPQLQRYRGLSGLDAALFTLLAAGLLRRELAAGARRPGRWRSPALLGGMLLAFAAKVGWEAATGDALFVGASPAFVPVPLAHLVGGACGAVAGAWPSGGRRRGRRGAAGRG